MPEQAAGSPSVLAFDVGGSHVSNALCQLDSLKIVAHATAPLPADPTADEFVGLLYQLARQTAADRSGVVGAVLAVPGPFDLAAGVSRMQHKLKQLYGVDLRRALAQLFGWKPGQFRFLNDAAAFALGEVHQGGSRGSARAVGITLGTGIGSAFTVGTRWVTSGKGVPPGGEIWNLPYGGGTVEDLISTRAIQQAFKVRTGRDEQVVTIAGLANYGDKDANAVFEQFGTHLGMVFRTILAPFAPEVVVIGGGIARSAKLFLPYAQKQVQDLGFRLALAELGDTAALVGAAAYWREASAH